ncbi:hypothetical protein Clacol_007478 [Clathrus columnatus]|uniref:Uncharacterized protein n=1 Tax=Clathrus columnatus TaxID=1419009 RepID=A0AAV5AHU2_9AGAM|nr:hypothetical protein Clacol_007478 [Clathrus columnatus]
MFALGTIHLGSNLRRILNAFVSTANDPFPDPEVYFADLAGLLYRLKNIIILVQIIMLDILLTYRCYIIWDRRLLITLLPLTGVLVYLITGIGAIQAFAVYKHDTIFTGTPRKWVSAALSTTFVTKLISTILIGSLVPRKNSSWQAFINRNSSGGCIYKIFIMTIETGSLAFLGTLILLPTYLSRSNAQETMLNTLSSLTGEAFVLIFISGLLGFIPSNCGPSRTRSRQKYNPQKSIIPTFHHPAEKSASRTSSNNSVFHFKDKKTSSDDTTSESIPNSKDPSDDIIISVIPASPPKSAQIAPPELVYTATTKMPVFDPLAYKSTELEVPVPKLSQHRHPFAVATPVTFP